MSEPDSWSLAVVFTPIFSSHNCKDEKCDKTHVKLSIMDKFQERMAKFRVPPQAGSRLVLDSHQGTPKKALQGRQIPDTSLSQRGQYIIGHDNREPRMRRVADLGQRNNQNNLLLEQSCAFLSLSCFSANTGLRLWETYTVKIKCYQVYILVPGTYVR